MPEQFVISWHDSGREPLSPPDPAYPDGIDVVCVDFEGQPSCFTDLPYPARRCGVYHLRCSICGATMAITTAGRSDDPRSLRMACDRKVN